MHATVAMCAELGFGIAQVLGTNSGIPSCLGVGYNYIYSFKVHVYLDVYLYLIYPSGR